MRAIRDWLYVGKYRETLDEQYLSTYAIDAMLQLEDAVKQPDDEGSTLCKTICSNGC